MAYILGVKRTVHVRNTTLRLKTYIVDVGASHDRTQSLKRDAASMQSGNP